MSNILENTTAQEQQKKHFFFTDLLYKCLVCATRRNPENAEILTEFCNQAVKDAVYLQQSRELSSDIVESIVAREAAKISANLYQQE